MRKAVRAALCLLVVSGIPMGAWATTVVEMSTLDMAQEASLIVSGHVTNVQSQWVGRDLVTLTTIAVSEVLKGQAGSEITVVVPGGVDTNRQFPIAMSVPAAPRFQDNENTVVFLINEDELPNTYALVGFSQGKFTLVDTPEGKAVTQDTSGLSLVGGSGSGQITHGGSRTIPYGQLKKQIEGAIAALPKSE